MLEFLKKPYPFNDDLMHNAKIIFFISIVVSGFAFFFEPFNFNSLQLKDKFMVSLILGTITFSVLSFYMLVLPSYIKKFLHLKNWNVWKEILWNTILFVSVSIGYLLYFHFNKIFQVSVNDALKIFFFAFLTISVLVILNQNRLVKLNLDTALQLNEKLLSKLNSENERVLLKSEYKKDSITLNPNDIRVIKSAGNYTEVFYFSNGKLNRHILRNSLKNIEEILKKYGFIFRCHRTYMINVNFIEKAEGSPQGIKLKMKNTDFLIPVSRNYAEKLKEVL